MDIRDAIKAARIAETNFKPKEKKTMRELANPDDPNDPANFHADIIDFYESKKKTRNTNARKGVLYFRLTKLGKVITASTFLSYIYNCLSPFSAMLQGIVSITVLYYAIEWLFCKAAKSDN